MNLYQLVAVALLASTSATTVPAAPAKGGDPRPDEIVARADAVRNPDASFRSKVSMTEYRNGSQGDSNAMVVHAKLDARTQQYRNIVQFSEPARDKGKLVLFNGGALWFYDPSAKASVRLSPQQRLVGQASDGDVLTVNMARDYAASLVAGEQISGSDRQPHSTFHLLLTARTDGALYAKLDYWVDVVDSHPIKARFYSDSGRVLKIAYYGKYASALGAVRPTEVVIIDGVDPKLVTRVAYSDFRSETIDDAWFQRDYLPRIPPE